ncbi:TPA: aldehyde dehydrogenase family protein [Burkholderia stabilis]|nr:aldehyde dehydrogenase family protein [Burkholderia stabilis]HDR9646510.1 aldehyde dehydrogenase family protein [Burkholderia stabilis]HDR9657237.1 aldehyde dehydrogenase family protein [Burkholderia stabilis]HDR9678180.1 aldehyde dehydrogenase family protein [Burkholderia stabilis]
MTNGSTYFNHINGEWCASLSGATFDNLNPADTRDLVGRFQASNAADATAAIQAAAAAFKGWKALSVAARAKFLLKAADYLEQHVERFADDLTREEGKPRNLARDEFLRSAQTLRFYAIEAQSFGGETFPTDDPKMSVYTLREPLGVVTIISPWNFPVSIPARKIAPALVCGNTVVFKPSSDAPLSGLHLTEALVEAGLPRGVLNLVTGRAGEIGPSIIEAPEIRAISFTGSTSAGEQIHRAASLSTRTQMELGGKNPLIVLDESDVPLAVELTIKGGFSLSGQACTGTSRVLVTPQAKPAFVAQLVEQTRALKIGSGMTAGTVIGPLATASQLRTVLSYIEQGKQEATLAAGGAQLTDGDFAHGYYVEPTIFVDVPRDARIAREEIFGPVIAVIDVADYDDAIAVANDTEYGLAAALATRDAALMERFAGDIEAGTVKINRTTTGNLVNAPFGGLKRSSTATFRESGRDGLEFFLQTKTVYRGV